MGSQDNKTGGGFVREMIVGFEMMGSEAGTGEDLKRISELKFRESLENSS